MVGLTTVLKDASATRSAVLDLFKWATSIRFAYAWMSIDGRGSPWEHLPTSKIEQGVLGLQFAGTHPDVLVHLHSEAKDRVQVMYETAGTFHPKVLVGTAGNEARAIIGSSNFTAAAFASNYELNLELAGAKDWRPIKDLIAVINGYYTSPKSRDLDERLIDKYRSVWKRRTRPPRLKALTRSRNGGTIGSASDLDIGWDEYRDLLLDQDDRDFIDVEGSIRVIPTATDDNAYLTEVRRVHAAFEKHASLAGMSRENRQLVSGFGPSLGWFGRMSGAGYFKQLVNDGAKGLSEALDRIPRRGAITDKMILEASKEALALRGVGLGCWTRLLSVKRPDTFLSVNSASINRIRTVFGSAPSGAQAYLKLTRRILDFPWASSAPPANKIERELWSARVALLDALLYEPVAATGPG